MRNIFKNTVIIFVMTALVIIPLGASSFAEEDPFVAQKEGIDPALIAFDILLIRPFGIGSILAGSFIFAVAYPFSYLTGETRMTYEKLIKEPVKYTFKRRIGDF